MPHPRRLVVLGAALGLLLSACGQLGAPDSEPLVILDDGHATGDLSAVTLQNLAFGDVCGGDTVQRQVAVYARTSGRGGSPPHTGNQIWRNSAVLTVAPTAVPAGFAANAGGIALPSTWQNFGNNVRSSNTLLTVSFTAGAAPGPAGGTLSYAFTGLGTTTPTVTRVGSLGVSATVVACNEAPVISIQQPLEFEGDTAGGWSFASFALIGTASDAEDGSPVVTCSPAVGAVLPLGATTVTCTATDSAGARASATGTVRVVDTTPPALTCPPAASGWVGAGVALGAASASDLVDPAPSVWSDAPASFGPGTTLVQWTAEDASGNRATCSQAVQMSYRFDGFHRPVDMMPTVNVAKAGSAVPVKFSLGGYQGYELFVSGAPGSRSMGCSAGAALDAVEETASPGASMLGYDPASDQYTYVWKTQKSWAGSCRQLLLQLNDGSAPVVANFRFTR